MGERHWGVKLPERTGGEVKQERSRWLNFSAIKEKLYVS